MHTSVLNQVNPDAVDWLNKLSILHRPPPTLLNYTKADPPVFAIDTNTAALFLYTLLYNLTILAPSLPEAPPLDDRFPIRFMIVPFILEVRAGRGPAGPR